MSNKDYFFCYTKHLSDYLVENGFRYITVAKSLGEKESIFALFERTPQLSKAIEDYNESK